MRRNIYQALMMTVLTIVFLVIVYSAVIFGAAQMAPNHGKGRVIEKNGKIIGFTNVGQSFTVDKYFYSRPSAVNYNAAGSGGSNKGPSNPEYLKQVQARIDTFIVHNPTIKKSQIPVEMVTASGSGLDPHISPESALIQIPRISKIRNISEDKIKKLVEERIEYPYLGFLGTHMINVLELNVALDELKN